MYVIYIYVTLSHKTSQVTAVDKPWGQKITAGSFSSFWGRMVLSVPKIMK